MLNAVLENPHRVSKLPKFLRAVEGMGQFKLSEQETPDYFSELVSAQLPAMRNGKPLFVTPDVPINDIGRLNRKDVLSSLHPLIKVWAEDVPQGGANFFTGGPLEQFPGELDEELNISKRTLHNLGALAPPIQKAARSMRAWRRDEFLEFMASEFSGLRVRPVDVRRVTRGAKFREEALTGKYKRRYQQQKRLKRRAEREGNQ